MKAIKVETLKPTFPGDDVKRVKMTYGPYQLKAANSTKRVGNFFSLDPQGTGWMNLASDFPTDITILNSHMTIHFADGTPISNSNGVYDHHAFVIDSSRAPEAHIGCAGSKTPIMPISSIMGNSAEAMGDAAQGGFGLTTRPITGNYVGKGHTVALQLDLVNYNNRTEEVYITADMSYVAGREKGIWETAVHLVPVGICKGIGGLAPPKGAQKWTLADDGFRMQDNGKLMYVRGHMHGKSLPRRLPAALTGADGSINMVFDLNGKQICDSRTEYNAAAVGSKPAEGGHSHGGMDEAMMGGISICANGTDYKKGDKLSIAANYDLGLHPL